MNNPKKLLEKISAELKTFTLEEVAELAGLVLSESHFVIGDEILTGFAKGLDVEERKFLVNYVGRKSYRWTEKGPLLFGSC